MSQSKQIILASASPRRKELLNKIVKEFKVVSSSVDESKISARTPIEFAKKAAEAKAMDIANKYKNSIIIGADTIVLLGKKILGKPKNKKEAVEMLKSLAGKKQYVITGIAVIDSKTLKKKIDMEITEVKMKKVSVKDIIDYVAKFKPIDKAGGYGIQELDEIFIEYIKGDYDNVVGLPVLKLGKMLKGFV